MTNKEYIKTALEDTKDIVKSIKGMKDLKECVGFLNSKGYGTQCVSKDMYDIYGRHCITTIEKEKNKIKVLSTEVWNDECLTCLGTFTIKELKKDLRRR